MPPLIGNRLWLIAAAAALVAAWFLPGLIGRYYTQMLALAGIYAIVAQGLNLLAGYTGQTSLGHAGFYAPCGSQCFGGMTARASAFSKRASRTASIVSVMDRPTCSTSARDR